jgi:hypothetical protein
MGYAKNPDIFKILNFMIGVKKEIKRFKLTGLIHVKKLKIRNLKYECQDLFEKEDSSKKISKIFRLQILEIYFGPSVACFYPVFS